jgi:hypothetical protein
MYEIMTDKNNVGVVTKHKKDFDVFCKDFSNTGEYGIEPNYCWINSLDILRKRININKLVFLNEWSVFMPISIKIHAIKNKYKIFDRTTKTPQIQNFQDAVTRMTTF